MFGIALREHQQHYDYSAEWVAGLKKLYSETAPFDYEGKYFRLKNVEGKPKPFSPGRPMLMSAGSSPAAGGSLSDNVDCLFMVITQEDNISADVAAVRAVPGADNSGLYASGHLLCRPTPKETGGVLSLPGPREGRLGGGRADHPQARRRRLAIAAARVDAQDDGAHHQRRRDLSRDRQLRSGRRKILAAVAGRVGRHGHHSGQLCQRDADRSTTRCCRGWSACKFRNARKH